MSPSRAGSSHSSSWGIFGSARGLFPSAQNCFFQLEKLFFATHFFFSGQQKWKFSDFRVEKNKSELKQKGHEPSRAELKILQLELWLEPARLGLITYLPMSDIVGFIETYLFKVVRFWPWKVPTPKTLNCSKEPIIQYFLLEQPNNLYWTLVFCYRKQESIVCIKSIISIKS